MPLVASRRAAQIVAAVISAPPASVVAVGTSAKSANPSSAAHSSSRNFSDCVAEMSAPRKLRVRQ